MANFPSSSLEPGMSGSQVKQLQQYLISMGYSIPDGATGYYGPQTKAAVTQLQRDLGVDTGGYDGYWGPKTQQQLTKMTGDTGSTQTNTTTKPANTSALQQAANQGYLTQSSNSNLYFPTPQAQQQVQQPVAPTPVQQPPVQPPTNQPVSVTGNPALDAIYKEIEDIVAKMGQINPKANITPAMLDNFYNQAVQNMSPYYKEQLNMIRNDLTTSAKYLNEQYESQRDRAAQDFRQSLGLSRERDAGAGLAFSGAGTRRELETTSALNRSLEDMYRTTESNLSSRLLDTESKIGTAALPSLPSLNMYRASNLGKGAITSTGSNIIRPLTGITGSMEREKTTAIEKEKARLESAERTRQLNNY